MQRSSSASIFAAALILASPAMAQAPADFFAGKQITLLIGFGPAGTYDYYARLVARHMGKHIPGTPNIVPQQMPGAGSLTAANVLYGASPKDGTAMAALSQTLAIEEEIPQNVQTRLLAFWPSDMAFRQSCNPLPGACTHLGHH